MRVESTSAAFFTVSPASSAVCTQASTGRKGWVILMAVMDQPSTPGAHRPKIH